MTDIDLAELGELCARHFGGKADTYVDTFSDFSGKFRAILLADAAKVVTEMVFDDATPARVTGRYLVRKIIEKCIGVPLRQKKLKPVYPDCRECDRTGFVIVPHPNDWVMGGEFWNGEHTCAVACNCEAGQQFAGYHRTLANYEGEFTNWREEYPLRYLERRAVSGLKGADHELEEFHKRKESVNHVSEESDPSESSGCSDPAARHPACG